jgi:hypothetical protein
MGTAARSSCTGFPVASPELPPVPLEVLPSVDVAAASPVVVLADVSGPDVLAEPPLVVTVAVVSTLELEPPLLVLVVVAAELVPLVDEALDAELFDACPLPLEPMVSLAWSPDELPPPLQAQAQARATTHANGLCRTQLMRVNLAPRRARRKQLLSSCALSTFCLRVEKIVTTVANDAVFVGERAALKFYWSVR